MTNLTQFSRRGFMIAAASTSATASAFAQTPPRPVNPLVRQRADAQIIQHEDGFYYFTATVPEYDRLIVRRSRTIAGLQTAGEVVIWKRPPEGKMGGYIWAPEIHHFDGQWHLYFGAGDKGQPFRVRTYVISSPDPNPLTGRWGKPVLVEMPWDTFNLDATTFVHNGTRYLLWAQKEPGIETNSNLYLAPMASPSKLATTPVRLTVPVEPWEIVKLKVAEAPTVLHRNGRLFLTYSVNATDDNYCLGMLTADENADLMTAASWIKSAGPVFKSSPENKVWGPGHNSFIRDEQGRDVLVYHGRDYQKITGNSLFDPNRHTRVQPFGYTADGVPDFGEPVANGALMD